MAAHLFSAGYHPEVFVDQLAIIDYICAICHMVVRQPHLTSCCGNLFCEVCIEVVKKAKGPCPMCTDTSLTTFHNKRVARILQVLLVKCLNHKEECKWGGELRQLEAHLLQCSETVTRCEYHEYGCSEQFKNRNLADHLRAGCEHHLVMVARAHEKLKQKNKTVEEEKRQLRQTIATREHELTTATGELERLNTELKSLQITESISWQQELLSLGEKMFSEYKSMTPIFIKLSNYSQNKQRGVQWFSCSFYTSNEGYKWCMRVDCNGYDKGKGTHLSVYFYLKRGEYDEKLQWPFRGRFVIQLQNQLRNAGHWEDILTFSKSVPEVYRSKVVHSERSERGWGKHMYILHELLPFNPQTGSQYLKENTLIFKIFTAIHFNNSAL